MDDKFLCKISNNETQTFEVESGQHQFSAKIDWLASETIQLHFDTTTSKKLELGSPVKEPVWFIILSAVILFGGIFLAREYHSQTLLWIVFGVFFTLQIAHNLITKQKPILYYITFGRKEYLYLKEV